MIVFPPSNRGRRFLVSALLVLLVAGAGVGWWAWRRHHLVPPGPTGNGFVECAGEVGINFRMSFLPSEQGEKFKINLYDHGCGVAVADFDGDGYEDIYFTNQLGANALYRNKGDGTFEDVTRQAGVALGDRVCVAATFADYDNDGRPDLYVTSTRGGNVLFHNEGNGTFKDVTREARVTLVAHSQTAVFFDYDNDGWLDLFVTNTAEWTALGRPPDSTYYPGPGSLLEMVASPKEHNVLYHNNQDGTFTVVTKSAGLEGKGWGGDVAVFDYDGDGRLDLLVTNMFGASQLYRNEGGGKFTDVTASALGRISWGAIGSKAFDYDNDGKLDLLLVDMHSDMWLPAGEDDRNLARQNARRKFKTVLGPLAAEPENRTLEQKLNDLFQIHPDEVVFGNTLFHNRGGGKFEEVSDKANMETFWPWGIAVGDFDNDGYQDVYLPSGMGYPYIYWPSALMMNNGNGTFTDRAREAGIEPPPGGEYLEERIGGKRAPRSSRCAAVADFDGDGRLDLVANNFNGRAYYFQNIYPRKNYIAFRLTGARTRSNPRGSNRDAIGALVTLHIGKEIMVRQVQAAGGYLSQSSRTLHFGLGDRPVIDRVDIRWPSGLRETILHPTLNTRHDLLEGEHREDGR